MNIGNAIVKMRKKKQIKAKALADAIGLSQTALSQIENGHATPTRETVEKVADFFGVDIDIVYMLAIEPDKAMENDTAARFKQAFPDFHETLLSFIK